MSFLKLLSFFFLVNYDGLFIHRVWAPAGVYLLKMLDRLWTHKTPLTSEGCQPKEESNVRRNNNINTNERPVFLLF